MANLVYSRDVRLIEIRESITIIYRINRQRRKNTSYQLKQVRYLTKCNTCSWLKKKNSQQTRDKKGMFELEPVLAFWLEIQPGLFPLVQRLPVSSLEQNPAPRWNFFDTHSVIKIWKFHREKKFTRSLISFEKVGNQDTAFQKSHIATITRSQAHLQQ